MAWLKVFHCQGERGFAGFAAQIYIEAAFRGNVVGAVLLVVHDAGEVAGVVVVDLHIWDDLAFQVAHVEILPLVSNYVEVINKHLGGEVGFHYQTAVGNLFKGGRNTGG
ncbi:MAG: hypothetical protein BWX83_00085 [Candidatus Cloacimonetes bacterium ADurb.Bin117]|nr:MAG: hypothetical protein BWX83_00085 [Candidatus Cloacimonetes bacterium ADurb.Bin117]